MKHQFGLPIVAASVALLAPLQASDALFSPDGQTVTASPLIRTGALEKVDLGSGSVKFVPLTGELKDAEVASLARGAEGETMFLAKDALWILKEGEAVRRIASTAPLTATRDLFVDTKAGSPTLDWIFLSGLEPGENGSPDFKFFARKPGGKKFISIFCRRVGQTLGGSFSESGRLFFSGDFDLWEGGFQASDDMGEDRLATLVGARIAPLGAMNTDEANGGGMGVSDVCPAGRWLYVHLHGHHMDAVVRVPIPAKTIYSPKTTDLPTVKAAYATMMNGLGKAEVIDEDLSDISAFCACEVDGKPRVFWRGSASEEGKGRELLLWEGSGKPRVIGHEPVEK